MATHQNFLNCYRRSYIGINIRRYDRRCSLVIYSMVLELHVPKSEHHGTELYTSEFNLSLCLYLYGIRNYYVVTTKACRQHKYIQNGRNSRPDERNNIEIKKKKASL